MENIQSLLESSNPWKSLLDDSQRFVKKWAPTGLLEGLDSVSKTNMSMMLESQAKQLVVESSTTNSGGSTFTSGQGEQWAGVALPLVRKIFGQIAAKDFVSVQPMSLPAGLVFFLDFQYGVGKAPFTAGDSVYGVTSGSAESNGGLYGAGRFGYSINEFSASVSSSAAGYTSSSATWGDVNYDSDFSASAAAGSIVKITITTASLGSANVDVNAIRSFVIASGSTVTTATNLPQFNVTNAGKTNITFFVTSSVIVASSTFQVMFSKQTVDNNRGDFEDGSSFGTPNSGSASAISIPDLNVSLRSEPIVAKTRKLKAQWTPEFAQDLNAYQSLDAEAEITSVMSEYISLEIDLEILDMLIQNAPVVEYWSAVNNTTVSATSNPAALTSGYYNSQGGWFQTLGTKVQKISNKIHQRTMRGGANFMVLSPTVSTVIESIPGFSSDNSGDVSDMKYAFGVQKVGTFNSRYKVYKNPYMQENVILLGLRGSQFLETGAVFAPYIPLIMTPLVYDPNTFTPRKGLLTRYAKKMVRPEFYGKIYVSGLNTI